MGIFVKFWPFLSGPAHQIWSRHVTQEANFQIFLFCPYSTFNIRKSHEISGGKTLYFRSYQPKLHGETPPPSVSLGLSVSLVAEFITKDKYRLLIKVASRN